MQARGYFDAESLRSGDQGEKNDKEEEAHKQGLSPKIIKFVAMHTLLMAAILSLHGGDTLRIMFIYGSRPAAKYKKTEPTWFGGIYGGHVGMEIGEDSVLSFRSTEVTNAIFSTPEIQFRVLRSKRCMVCGDPTFPPPPLPDRGPETGRLRHFRSVPEQKRKIDSIAEQYLRKTPYDYATAGMRCASATYDILARAGLAHGYGGATWWRILIARDLRIWLFEKAASTEGVGWRIYRYEGTKRRIWEGDD